MFPPKKEDGADGHSTHTQYYCFMRTDTPQKAGFRTPGPGLRQVLTAKRRVCIALPTKEPSSEAERWRFSAHGSVLPLPIIVSGNVIPEGPVVAKFEMMSFSHQFL
jgi:hypothetical protein